MRSKCDVFHRFLCHWRNNEEQMCCILQTPVSLEEQMCGILQTSVSSHAEPHITCIFSGSEFSPHRFLCHWRSTCVVFYRLLCPPILSPTFICGFGCCSRFAKSRVDRREYMAMYVIDPMDFKARGSNTVTTAEETREGSRGSWLMESQVAKLLGSDDLANKLCKSQDSDIGYLTTAPRQQASQNIQQVQNKNTLFPLAGMYPQNINQGPLVVRTGQG